MNTVDILIVGGAAGLMSAYAAANYAADRGKELSIRIIERQDKPARKILASGNGRCNLGHEGELLPHYRGSDPSFIAQVLQEIDNKEYENIFNKLGLILTADESGRIYPFTMRSDTVDFALQNALRAHNVACDCNLEVKEIYEKTLAHEKSLIVDCEATDSKRARKARHKLDEKAEEQGIAKQELYKMAATFAAKAVIVASGSLSQSQLSGHDSGYKILQKLGHECTALFPALVPLNLADAKKWRRAAGMRVRASARYQTRSGFTSDAVSGEFLFTDYGVSGIAAMELAEEVERDTNKKKGNLLFDFFPQLSLTELQEFIYQQILLHPQYSWLELLNGLFPAEVLQVLLREVEAEKKVAKTKEGSYQLAQFFKAVTRDVKSSRGYKFSQVTAGGIYTDTIDPQSMESKIIDNLYIAGEVLDVNADTGGYNLRWAFSTGYLAGIHAAEKILS